MTTYDELVALSGKLGIQVRDARGGWVDDDKD